MHKEKVLGMSQKGFFYIKNTKGIYFLGSLFYVNFLKIFQMPNYSMSFIDN
jgi:hypothetical protein